MKLGEILDQGFTLYRRNFWKLAGTTVLPALIMISLQVVDRVWIHLGLRIGRPVDRTDAWGLGFLVWLIFSHIAAFVHPLFYPAVVKVTTGILFDEPVSVTEALRFAAERWRGYLWLDLLKNAAAPLLPEAIGFGLIAALAFADETFHLDPQERATGFIVFLIILAVVGVCFWIAACVAFAVPAAAVEGIGGFRAIRRSWRLSRGARFQVFLTWMTTFILIMFLWFAIGFIVRSIESFLYGTLHLHFVNQTFYFVSIYILAAVYDSAIGPIYPVLLLLLYLNQRVRKEGYDVEQMMEAAGLAAPVPKPASEAETAPAVVGAADPAVEVRDRQAVGESRA
jgi:hypothetical protein